MQASEAVKAIDCHRNLHESHFVICCNSNGLKRSRPSSQYATRSYGERFNINLLYGFSVDQQAGYHEIMETETGVDRGF